MDCAQVAGIFPLLAGATVAACGMGLWLTELGLRLLNTAAGVSRGGLAVGRSIPSIAGEDQQGSPVRFGPDSAAPALIILARTECAPCRRLMPDLARFADDHPDLAIRILTADGRDANREFASEHGLRTPVIHAPLASAAFETEASPFAFAVADGGRIVAKGLVNRYADLDQLSAEFTLAERSP